MGLTLGEMRCINCKEHEFSLEEFNARPIYMVEKRGRGEIAIDKRCPECEAMMALSIFDHPKGSPFAIAYSCTMNDEPCYNEECGQCSIDTGEKGWWE